MLSIIASIIFASGTAIPDTNTVLARGQEWEYTDVPISGECLVVFYDNDTPDNIEDDIILAIKEVSE